MNNTQHTPAPWAVDDGMIQLEDQSRILLNNIGTESEWVCIGLNDEEGIAEVVSLCHPANAHLISAAPDLLSALDLILNKINAHGLENKHMIAAIEKAELALSKAKGAA